MTKDLLFAFFFLLATFHSQFRLGFRGRKLIHPSQIEPANRLYSPAAREIAESLRLVEAFDAAVARGHASVLFEGTDPYGYEGCRFDACNADTYCTSLYGLYK